MADRFGRNEAFFGKNGQEAIRKKHVVVVGASGLGSHVILELALLGVGSIGLVEPKFLTENHGNRVMFATERDIELRLHKLDAAVRAINAIDHDIEVTPIKDSVLSTEAFQLIQRSHAVIGCVDREGVRLVLNELCSAYAVPYFDLATEIGPMRAEFGGRVCTNVDGAGCLLCLGVLDRKEADRDLAGPLAQMDHDKIYGVNRDALGSSGPSVVSLNGVVASLGVTEFMVHATGIREPARILNYYGRNGTVTRSKDASSEFCWYCGKIRGTGAKADVEHYLNSDAAKWL